MNKKGVKIIAAIIACMFLLGIVGPLLLSVVYGAPTDAKLEQMKKEEQEAIAQVKELERQLNAATDRVFHLEESLKTMEEEMKVLDEELIAAEEAELNQMEKFKKRMAVVCEKGSTSYLDLIFSATSFSNFIDRVVIAQEIAEYDNNILDSMRRIKEEIKTRRAEMEELKVKQEAEKAELETALTELEAKKEEASSYMKELQNDRQKYEAYLDAQAREKEAAKNRAGIISTGKADLSKVGSGGLLWPTPSWYITSPFSPNRVNPVTGVLRPHTGTDVGASQGEPIWAAKGGTVILAEYNGGYGNCVIISHGNGVNTLYGHMSAILVSKGAKVSQGQQIGRVGSTGNSTGPHLHFEVLIDGTPVDPMQFF